MSAHSADPGEIAERIGRTVRSAVALAGASAEVLDFLLPLWAGSALKAGPTAIGALIAVEAALSLLVRPLAGELADRLDPRRIAAVGAGLYAVSFAGYALAPSLPLAFAAAAVGGAGGALFWVSLDTWTGRHLSDAGSAAYGSLLAASGEGAFIGYLVAFSALDDGGYPLLFGLSSAACAIACVLLVAGARSGPRSANAGDVAAVSPSGEAAPLRRLLPLMSATAVTAGAEAGLWMLLLLRLQRDLGLQPVQIAWVFAPGFAVFVLVPKYAHLVTDRLGRTRTMTVAFVASAVFAGALGAASGPVVIAVLWALAAACFSAQLPVEQATVAAAGGARVGRAMGLYESARLAGVLAGPVLMGAVYEWRGWGWACAVAAGAAAACATAAPFAVRVLRLPEGDGRVEEREWSHGMGRAER
ncbi:MFS transporter [Streptomyces sp. NRRL WC-3742]|uniref:MFS transporter n=1 Tax=Streptomyces sp. NRRL WC-3742 TaxID=1463934 RepID=UPI00068FDBF4|nr:MFS transporter [Streptomyces sp. NRRL WC-3742]